MRDIWYQAVHGSIRTRIAVWGAAAVYLLLAFVLNLGWLGFILRAGLLFVLAVWFARWLTTRKADNWFVRALLWIGAVAVVGFMIAAIVSVALTPERWQ